MSTYGSPYGNTDPDILKLGTETNSYGDNVGSYQSVTPARGPAYTSKAERGKGEKKGRRTVVRRMKRTKKRSQRVRSTKKRRVQKLYSTKKRRNQRVRSTKRKTQRIRNKKYVSKKKK